MDSWESGGPSTGQIRHRHGFLPTRFFVDAALHPSGLENHGFRLSSCESKVYSLQDPEYWITIQTFGNDLGGNGCRIDDGFSNESCCVQEIWQTCRWQIARHNRSAETLALRKSSICNGSIKRISQTTTCETLADSLTTISGIFHAIR